jgi:hypothetical protein
MTQPRGHIAEVSTHEVAGWALDDSGAPVALEVVAEGLVIARGVADMFRPDLAMAGLGEGRCGFLLPFRPPLPAWRDHLLHVRRASDGAELPGSPLLLPRPYQAEMAPALAGITVVPPQERALLLANAIDFLLAKRATR